MLKREGLSVDGIPAEHCSCPGCGEKDQERYARYRDFDCGVSGVWNLVRCKACDLIYLNPRPKAEAFQLIYPSNYVPYQMELRPDTRWLMKVSIKQAYEGGKVRILKKIGLNEKARILDVGCGAGFFLSLLKRQAWEAVGVEPNRVLVERAHQLKLDVRCGTLSTATLEPASFDAISLWHCLEHDPTPRETLTQCHRLLKERGVVIAQVPDHDSWEAKRLGNYFWGNDIPRHLIFFTRSSLIRMAQERGFIVEMIQRTRNATSWLWSLLRYVKWDLYQNMEKNIGTISLLYGLIVPFYYAFSRGDWITAILRKDDYAGSDHRREFHGQHHVPCRDEHPNPSQ